MKYAVSSAGSVAVAMMSRSRNVSLRRRTEPASETCTAAGCSRKHRDDRLHRGQPVAEQPAAGVRVLRLERERLEDLLLALRAEAGQRAQPLLLGRGLQLVDRRDAELLPDARRRLRPEPRQAHEADDVGRNAALAFRERLDLALLDDLDDLLLDRLADSLQLLRPPVERELRDRARRLAHPRRGAAVGEHAKRLRAFELEQVGEQVELVRHVGVGRSAATHRSYALRVFP